MISETCLKLKQDHDTVSGIINGCYLSGRMLTCLGVTKPVTNFGQLSQSESDQVTAQVGYHAPVPSAGATPVPSAGATGQAGQAAAQ
jgi:hypothetical protein